VDEQQNGTGTDPHTHTVARRGLVAVALAAAAALVLEPEHAAATDPNDVVKGAVNLTTTTTTITNTHTTSSSALALNATAASYGIGLESTGSAYGVIGVGTQYAGVFGDTSGTGVTGVTGQSRAVTGRGVGVGGYSASPQGAGVQGTGGDNSGGPGIGVVGNAGHFSQLEFPPGAVGVFGTADVPTGVGGVFAGGLAPLRLMPSAAAGAPAAGGHEVGELVVSSDARLFLCTSAGTPGIWVEMRAKVATPTLVLLPTPERFVDTRSGLGGVQGQVPGATTHTFSMTGRNGESGSAALRIPDAATSIVGNLTVVGAIGVTLGSFVTLWPSGDRPTVSNINFGPSTQTGAVANSFTVGLADVAGGHRGINVFTNGTCDYILDVTGYHVMT
jgi:hypothetical protein